MKLVIERKNLLDVLNRVGRIAPTNSPVAVLSNVVLTASPDGLNVRASDLDIEISETAPASVSVSGNTTVNAKMLSDIVRKLPDGAQVSIELQDGKPLIVKAGRSRFQLQTLPLTDFPDFSADISDSVSFKIPSESLSELLSRTSFAAANDGARQYLNGVHFHNDGDYLVAVATDGHRLARCRCNLPEAKDTPPVIIPRKTVSEVQKLAANHDDEVTVTVSYSQIRFEIGPTKLFSKLVDGVFPDYQQVIPTEQEIVVEADTKSFVDAVGRVSTVSTDRGRVIKLVFGNGKVSLSQRSDIGESEEEIEIGTEVGEITIGFNSKYLMDILDTADSEQIRIGMNDPAAPALFNPVGRDDVLYVAMPMRV